MEKETVGNANESETIKKLREMLANAERELAACRGLLSRLLDRIKSANDLHALFTVKDSAEFLEASKAIDAAIAERGKV